MTVSPSPHAQPNISGGDAPARVAAIVDDPAVNWEWVENVYRWFHQNPELSLQEEKTARRIAEELDAFDCEVTTGIGGHGITAVFCNGDGPTVLFRADFDALPVQEETGLEYASQNTGVMHACGHDAHTASLLGMCSFLDANRQLWSGTFIALFQPAEEVTKGALNMVEDGLTRRIPRPDVCLAQHITAGPPDTVRSLPGPILAACDTITITLHGRSAHASAPHEAIDPGFLAAMIVVRLQGIVGREVAANDFAVISVGTLSAGDTHNTIPATAKLVLNCRFYDTEVRDRTYDAIRRVVDGECAASGCPRPADIEFSAHGELTDNDPGVYDLVRPTFDAVFGENSLTADRWTASEDFSEIPRAFGVPYMFWLIGVTDAETWESAATPPGNHTGQFAPQLSSLRTCVRAGLAGVLRYLLADE